MCVYSMCASVCVAAWVCVMTLGPETMGSSRTHAKEVYTLSTWQNKRLIKRGDLRAVKNLRLH